MITMLMSNRPARKHRRISATGKILIILLSAAAVFCFAMAGIHGWRALHSKNEAVKHTRRASLSGNVQMSEDSSLNSEVVLKPTKDAGKDYINETLFLGDSNTVRFMQFLDSEGNTFTTDQNTIAVVGMAADGISNVPCEQLETGTYTMLQSVEILQPRRIILTFGTNNLSYEEDACDNFITSYEAQIRAIEEVYPAADLIINSIIPIAEANGYFNLDNELVIQFNEALLDMCVRNEWKYLNSYEALIDSSGYGRPSYMEYDGIHLNADGIAALFRYIRTHAWITEDKRGELADIPLIYGPITEIYTVDPLSHQEFSDDVLYPQTEQETPQSQPYEEPVQQEPVNDEPAGEEPVIEEPVTEDTPEGEAP